MKTIVMTTAVFLTFALTQVSTAGQVSAFDKRTYNFNDWTKGRFSEMVVVTNPGKFISVAGIGQAERSKLLRDLGYKK